MSLSSAHAFLREIERTPDLQSEVSALKGTGVLARLVALGAAHGFQFTAEEYRGAVVELAEGELSEAALDEVLREAGFK